jgi:cytochrome oxidase assembly protein ShyY1
MTHLPYVLAVYALGILLPVAFGLDAWRRVRSAERRLDAIDPRRTRGGSA